jgi:hypothetical protein
LPEEFKGRRRKSFGQKDGDDANSQYEEKEKIVLEGILFVYYAFPFCIRNFGIRLFAMCSIQKHVYETLYLIYQLSVIINIYLLHIGSYCSSNNKNITIFKNL